MAKKAATKTTSKSRSTSKSKSKSAPKRAGFDDAAKITWLYEDKENKTRNPCRDGSAKAKRVDNVIKHSGRSVAAFLESGGWARSLSYCVVRKWCRVG